ncbi:MAG: hypothetical protein HC804_11525, partial [Anaerolineae bacterium]|nr:hypothetical protein [Anaerolineae bacterium]
MNSNQLSVNGKRLSVNSTDHRSPITDHPPFTWGSRTYVMGIINATPDSFSGDGLMAGDEWVQTAV